ncbi:Peptidyl-prolyl cis-trans isomerase [Balamuthia mandrillaris]
MEEAPHTNEEETCLVSIELEDQERFPEPVKVELYPKRAPITVGKFLQNVETGLYRGAAFYRTVRLDNQPQNEEAAAIQVVQGGVAVTKEVEDQIPIMLESTKETGLTHKAGTISMARSTPNSATSEFFISLVDQPNLDHGGKRAPDGHGFAAFGRVVSGMDVLKRIHSSPAEEQMLFPVILIKDIVKS